MARNVQLGPYLQDWAIQYGFSIDQVRSELDRWAAEVAARKSSSYDLSLAAFAMQHFGEASDRALDVAAEAEANLAALDKEARESTGRAIRAYLLAGDAAFNDQKFDRAVSAYRKAVGHAPRDRVPVEWAGIQLRIGASEQELSLRAAGPAIIAHTEAAKQAYALALEIFSSDQLQEHWAAAQNGLGIGPRLGERNEGSEATGYLWRSVAAHRAVLRVLTPESFPQGWAAAQSGLGNALRDLGERTEGPKSIDYLEQSRDALLEALKVFARDQLPQAWAGTELNLGNTFLELSKRKEGAQATDYLEKCVGAYQSALEVYTSQQLRQDWAAVQINLGLAFRSLAEMSSAALAIGYLTQSVDAYYNALQVYTREGQPQDWAMAQYNVGNAFLDLSRTSAGARRLCLAKAIACYYRALEVMTRGELRQAWARAQNALGNALVQVADNLKDHGQPSI